MTDESEFYKDLNKGLRETIERHFQEFVYGYAHCTAEGIMPDGTSTKDVISLGLKNSINDALWELARRRTDPK